MSLESISQDLYKIYVNLIMSFIVSYMIVKISILLSNQIGFLILSIILIIMIIGNLMNKKREPIKVENFEQEIMKSFLKTSLN
jgi:hypothetical protein